MVCPRVQEVCRTLDWGVPAGLGLEHHPTASAAKREGGEPGSGVGEGARLVEQVRAKTGTAATVWSVTLARLGATS